MKIAEMSVDDAAGSDVCVMTENISGKPAEIKARLTAKNGERRQLVGAQVRNVRGEPVREEAVATREI
jgi:hypothetical protein